MQSTWSVNVVIVLSIFNMISADIMTSSLEQHKGTSSDINETASTKYNDDTLANDNKIEQTMSRGLLKHLLRETLSPFPRTEDHETRADKDESLSTRPQMSSFFITEHQSFELPHFDAPPSAVIIADDDYLREEFRGQFWTHKEIKSLANAHAAHQRDKRELDGDMCCKTFV